ncbi:carbohydrate kinase family protein [Puia dinghuensis]|uniref:Carbohydrate kinase n=1 Tax=Puia dinghuensis TaxID=1792502 RepID=A0A8J2UAV3_9BACT|nr:carbohydrate kinase [Puia dinghuensis]GGA90677.1 carbohydrate kinase [Puia dinghuensis]
MNQTQPHYPVVCFGEILWDILPQGKFPGGAPMNVAYHLKKLGLEPALVTRVGEDPNGQGLVGLMEANQVTTDFFQIDFELPTGTVHAMVGKDHEVTYDFPRPVAWDNIQWEEGFVPLLTGATYFVFGSLASRSRVSRKTLYRMLEHAPRRVFDINLRPPHYELSTLESLMAGLHLLKLNLAELELITGWFAPYRNATDRVRVLQDRFKIPNVVVTRGGDGAMLNHDGVIYEHPGFAVKLADTIGAGDAFLAGLLSQFADGADPPKALAFASAMGAFVAGRSGPCPDYQLGEVDQLISTNS